MRGGNLHCLGVTTTKYPAHVVLNKFFLQKRLSICLIKKKAVTLLPVLIDS